MTIMESGLGLRGNQRKTTSLKDSYVDLLKDQLLKHKDIATKIPRIRLVIVHSPCCVIKSAKFQIISPIKNSFFSLSNTGKYCKSDSTYSK